MTGKMSVEMPIEQSQRSIGGQFSNRVTPTGAAIHALEQQVIELDEAHYKALREARDASRRAAELRLRALETRMRLCAFIEYEPIDANQHTGIGTRARPAILRLAHMYFDDPGKYRLALCRCPDPDRVGMISGGVDEPAWYSKVVYDTTRPEGKGTVAISDAVRAAYRATEQRGYRLVWATTEQKPGDSEL